MLLCSAVRAAAHVAIRRQMPEMNLVHPIRYGGSGQRERIGRTAVVAGALGVCMCALALLHMGSSGQAEMAESNNLLDAFAELSPTARKADLRMVR